MASALVFPNPQGRRCLRIAKEGLRSLLPLAPYSCGGRKRVKGKWRVGLTYHGGPTLPLKAEKSSNG